MFYCTYAHPFFLCGRSGAQMKLSAQKIGQVERNFPSPGRPGHQMHDFQTQFLSLMSAVILVKLHYIHYLKLFFVVGIFL